MNTSTDKEQKIQTLIYNLSGTCNSMISECEDLDLDDDDLEVTTAVDQEIFCCTECSWWCDISEEASAFVGSKELLCLQCAEENYDYEE